DGDSWLDLLVADGPNNPVVLLLNQGESAGVWQGFAASPASLPVGFDVDAWSIAVGDLANDDDLFPDVFVGVRTGNDRILINLGAPMGTWLGFADESSRLGSNAATNAVRSVTIHDLNNDGDEDIIEGVTGNGLLRMLANDGSGQFSGTPQTLAQSATYNHALGDLNNDEFLDIFAVQNGQDQYRTNDGPSGENIILGPLFSAPTTNGFGSICRVADIDGSGTDDFLVADLDQEFPVDCTRRLHILFNSGSAPYLTDGYPIAEPWTPQGTSDVAVFDIDLDNDLDMLIGHCDGNSVFIQDNVDEPDFTRGEVNNDGSFNIADAIALLTHLFAPPFDLTCVDAADANDDSLINIADGVAILQARFGMPPTPLPAPVSCGQDPSKDDLGCEEFSGCP
ncbi:MAG: FG-GAP-like repeat-containing protein, partial [Planctomycetota bacterium]